MRIIFSMIYLLVLLLISYLLFKLQLEIDKNYGVFEWLESPTYNPLRDMVGILFSSVVIWLFLKSFFKKNLFKSPVKKRYQSFFSKIEKISVVLLYLPIILLAVYFIQNPPTEVSQIHTAKILSIDTTRLSKPYKTYYQIESWRDKNYETLSTHILEWKDAQKLKVHALIRVEIGRDWLGRERVLRVKAIPEDEEKVGF